jgi:hypothetical protein
MITHNNNYHGSHSQHRQSDQVLANTLVRIVTSQTARSLWKNQFLTADDNTATPHRSVSQIPTISVDANLPDDEFVELIGPATRLAFGLRSRVHAAHGNILREPEVRHLTYCHGLVCPIWSFDLLGLCDRNTCTL